MKRSINSRQALERGLTNFVIAREPKAIEGQTETGQEYIIVQGQFGEYAGSLYISEFEAGNFMDQLGLEGSDLTIEVVNGLAGHAIDLFENEKGFVTFREPKERE